MEFKLNKIDTDIINRIKESTKDDKVQQNNDTDIQKNIKNNLNDDVSLSNEMKPNSSKRFFTIDGMKHERKEVEILAEKIELMNFEKSKGNVLDTKK